MPLRALLADENLAVQKLVELTLNKEGIEVITTDNGLSALDISIKRPPDIILADFKLEGLDIFSFIQKIKKRERLSDIPIIVLVDSTETYDPVHLQSLGVDAFFKKPIDTQDLIEGIKKLSPISDPATNKTDSSDEAEVVDLSEHFSNSEDDSANISQLLGWSSPSESQQENDPVQEESSFSQSEHSTETDSMDEPTVFMTEDSGEDSQGPGEDIELQQNSPFDDQAGSTDDKNEREELLTTGTETEPFSSPFEDDPFSQTTEEGSKTDETEEPSVLVTPTSDKDSLDSNEDIELLQSSPFEDQVVVPEKKDDPFSFSEEPSSKEPSHPPIEDNTFSEVEPQDISLEDKPLDETNMDEADKNAVQSSAETIIKEMLPDLVKSSLSKEMIAKIVEGVVWEVVTPLAEAEIKKAIKHLQSKEA